MLSRGEIGELQPPGSWCPERVLAAAAVPAVGCCGHRLLCGQLGTARGAGARRWLGLRTTWAGAGGAAGAPRATPLSLREAGTVLGQLPSSGTQQVEAKSSRIQTGPKRCPLGKRNSGCSILGPLGQPARPLVPAPPLTLPPRPAALPGVPGGTWRGRTGQKGPVLDQTLRSGTNCQRRWQS